MKALLLCSAKANGHKKSPLRDPKIGERRRKQLICDSHKIIPLYLKFIIRTFVITTAA